MLLLLLTTAGWAQNPEAPVSERERILMQRIDDLERRLAAVEAKSEKAAPPLRAIRPEMEPATVKTESLHPYADTRASNPLQETGNKGS